ncbi:MAG: RMD1 family protein [Desulfobulbus sp.]|uniref:RMD1 family protein n=1 Tax=Desulfobulbus sp. TaxID=895 RepID=UPI00284BD893|nr:RMD1 family protein [Desulfobulbus sp.]MDR2548671.1 RMD1 family protein [Desulfobulbus sp.]
MDTIRALCLAERFQFEALAEFLSRQTHATPMRNVIRLAPDGGAHAFIFDYGVAVLFRYDDEAEKRLVDLLRKYAVAPLASMVEEELEYRRSTEAGIRIRNDVIELDDLAELTCLSLGHALAQSTKLAFFESSIEEMIKQTMYIPEALAKKGSIAMSRAKLARERGRVYLEKSRIILQFNLLDAPEFIWEYPELEQYYLALSRYLEITSRATVLKNRLEVIQELLAMMADEQKHSHSSMLEWIIIALIAIEIVLFFVK